MSEPENRDRVIRAMTDDGSFRVLIADTTSTVRAILEAQGVAAHSVDVAAGVVTSAVLVRETMAPASRVQAIYSDAIGGQVVGDAFPEGKTRGLARIADDVLGVRVNEGGVLRIERIIRAGKMHQGIIRTEVDQDLVATLRNYFLQSEQVTSMVDLACLVRDGEVTAAAGYVIQLLPELTDPPLRAMNDRLAAFGSLSDHVANHGAEPYGIMAKILDGEEHTLLADSPVLFHCPCDRNRVLGAAATLGEADLQDLLAKNEELVLTCDYCQSKYTLDAADYKTILQSGETDDSV